MSLRGEARGGKKEGRLPVGTFEVPDNRKTHTGPF